MNKVEIYFPDNYFQSDYKCLEIFLIMTAFMGCLFILRLITQPAFTCSKLIVKTLKVWKRSKSTTKTPKRRHWRRSGVFIVKFEHISHLLLVFLLLILNM